jgi:hypothetical protein
MKLREISDEEIREVRRGYTQALRIETQASTSTRRAWKIVIACLDDVVMRRSGKRTVLDDVPEREVLA